MMTTSVPYRRRAERFARLLDEAEGGRRHHARSPLDHDLVRLVELRHRVMSARPMIMVDPDFRAGVRAMLVATAERDGIGATARSEPGVTGRRRQHPSPGRGPRARTAVVAGIAVGAVAFAGMSHASENAVPGDTLYGLKRSTERAQLALAGSDLSRGQLYLDFARTRLEEARTVTSGLRPVLDDMDRHTIEGVRLLTGAAAQGQDLAVLDIIDRFTVAQAAALDPLGGDAPRADRARVAASLALLTRIERRSADLRENLPCATSVSRIDELGPTLADCAVSPPSPSQGAEPPRRYAGRSEPPTTPTRPAGPAPGTSTGPGATPGTVESGGPVPSASVVGPVPATPADQPTQEPAEQPARSGGLLGGVSELLDELFD